MSARVTRLAKVANGATRIGPVVVNVADLRGILATVADLRRRIRRARAALVLFDRGSIERRIADELLDLRRRIREAKRRCPVNETRGPAPGDVDAGKRATCPLCGKHVAVTVRGRYANHNAEARR